MAELDGTVLREKVAAFRILPHIPRYEPIELPKDITELIDLNTEQLEAMVSEDTEPDVVMRVDYPFDAIPNLRLPEVNEEAIPEGTEVVLE